MADSFLFRAEGSVSIGLGHLYRCLAIAESLKSKPCRLAIATKNIPKLLESEFKKRNIEILAIPPYSSAVSKNSWINRIVRSKKFGAVIADLWPLTDQTALGLRHAAGPAPLVCFDTGHLSRPLADVLVNPAIGHPSLFSGEYSKGFRAGSMRCLMGPQYFPLRVEFEAFKDRTGFKKNHMVRNVVVTLGGSDASGVVFKILDILGGLKARLQIDVIIGPSFPAWDMLRSKYAGSMSVGLHRSPKNLPKILHKADLCISAGGFTLYELAFLGVPTAALSLVAHQERTVGAFERRGIVVNLGPARRLRRNLAIDSLVDLIQDPSRRRRMSAHGRRLVDGRGSERIAELLYRL